MRTLALLLLSAAGSATLVGRDRAALPVDCEQGAGTQWDGGVVTDFSVPQRNDVVAFTRTYNNQHHAVGPLGVGWHHPYEGVLVEESTGRYSVHLAGQAFDFPACDGTATTFTCHRSDGTHGHHLDVVSSADGKTFAFLVTRADGGHLFFRTPAPGKTYVDASGQTVRIRQKWLLDAFDDGHGEALPTSTSSALLSATPGHGWTTLTYESPSTSTLLTSVQRVGAELSLRFDYGALPAGTSAPKAVLTARREGLKRLTRVTLQRADAVLYTVDFTHDAALNLTAATLTSFSTSSPDFDAAESASQQWAYTYARPGSRWESFNEVTSATQSLSSAGLDGGSGSTLQPQWVAEYARDGGFDAFMQASAFEVVTHVTLPGAQRQPIRLSGRAVARVVTPPVGPATEVTLAPYGAAATTTTGTALTSTTWDSQLLGNPVRPLSSRDATLLATHQQLDARLRPTAVAFASAYAGGAAVPGVTPGPSTSLVHVAYSDTNSQRYGVPTEVSFAGGASTATGAPESSRMTSTVDDDGNLTQLAAESSFGTQTLLQRASYDEDGLVLSYVDAQQRTVTVEARHPLLKLPTRVTWRLGTASATRTFRYDAYGHVTFEADTGTGEATTRTYDALGRLLVERHEGQPPHVWRHSYQALNNALLVTSRLEDEGRPAFTRVERYEDGRRVSSSWNYGEGSPQGARQATESWAYEGQRLVSHTDARGVTHTLLYNPTTGFVDAVTASFDGGSPLREVAASYDAEGRVLARVGPTGDVQSTQRNALAAAVGASFSSQPGSRETSFTEAGPLGNASAVVEGSHRIRQGVDALGNVRTRLGTIEGGAGTNGVNESRAYDDASRLTRLVDNETGLDVTFAYEDARGRLTSTVTTIATRTLDGGALTLSSSEGHAYLDSPTGTTEVVTVTSGARVETQTKVYDEAGRLLSVTAPVTGQATPLTVRFTYNARGQVLTRTDAAGGVSRFTYDATGALVEERDEAGNVTSYTRNALGQVEAQRGPHPEALQTWAYDALGRVTLHTEAGGTGGTDATWRFRYAGDGQSGPPLPAGATEETLPDGTVVTSTVNSRGQVTKRVTSWADGLHSLDVRRTYDGVWLEEETTTEDDSVATTSHGYDDRGRETSLVEAWSRGPFSHRYETDTTYTGRTLSLVRDWGGAGTPTAESSEVDSLGNLIARTLGQTASSRGTSRWLYDASGRLLASLPAGYATPRQYTYGPDGRLAVESFGPETTRYAYEARGLLAHVEAPAPAGVTWNTFRAYESRGLMTLEAFGDVDASETLSAVASANARLTAFAYNEAGQLTAKAPGCATVQGCDAVTRYGMGPRGDMLSVTLPGIPTRTWQYSFDGLHRLTTLTPPVGSPSKVQSFQYDGLGRETRRTLGTASWTTTWRGGESTQTSALGNQLVSQYDAFGRLVSRTVSPGAGSVSELTSATLRYDGLGALVGYSEVHANAPPVTGAHEYNDAHHLTRVTRTGSPTVVIVPRADGQRDALQVGASALGYAFDSLNRVSGVTGPWGSSTVAWVPGGRRLAAFEDVAPAGLKQVWNYDARGRLDFTTVNGLLLAGYSYDNRDNPTEERRAGFPARSMTYDVADRLTSVREVDGKLRQYQLNADGTRQTETVDGDVLSFAYDNNVGALTAVTRADGGVVNAYAVDADGRTTAIDGTALAWTADNRLAQVGSVAYTYTHAGLRSSSSDGRSWTSIFEEDIAESPQGATSAQVVLALAGFNLAQGNVRFGIDAQGSTLISSAGASTTWAAWGAPSTAPLLTQPSLGFWGARYDANAGGLTQLQQRWATARWLTPLSIDPLGPAGRLAFAQDINPLQLGAGNPLRYVDTDGRTATDRLRIELMYERPALERLKWAKVGTPEYAAAMRDFSTAQDMYRAEEQGEELGRIGFKLTVASGSMVVGGELAEGFGLLGSYLWSLGTTARVGLAATAVTSAPAVVTGVRDNYLSCAFESDKQSIDRCASLGFTVGGLLKPSAEIVAAAPGLMSRAASGAARYLADLRLSPSYWRMQTGAVRTGPGGPPLLPNPMVEAAEDLGRVVYPRGPGAATGPVLPGQVPVSRWVSEAEAKLWIENGGTYIPGGVGGQSGRVYVTVPGAPQPGGTGPVRIDFTVDSAALNTAGKEGWFQIIQPVQNRPIHNVTITYPAGR